MEFINMIKMIMLTIKHNHLIICGGKKSCEMSVVASNSYESMLTQCSPFINLCLGFIHVRGVIRKFAEKCY